MITMMTNSGTMMSHTMVGKGGTMPCSKGDDFPNDDASRKGMTSRGQSGGMMSVGMTSTGEGGMISGGMIYRCDADDNDSGATRVA